MGKTVKMSVEGKDLQEIGKLIIMKKMAPGLYLPLYWGYFPSYSNMFIGIYNRSQVSVYRTIGPLVVLFEPHHEKTGLLPFRKQRRRSAVQ